MFCRRPWTCTSRCRRRSTTACRLRPSRHRQCSNPTAPPRLPQSKQSVANRRWASTFAQRHSFSKRLRPRPRNRKCQAVPARPSPPACARHAMARSAAIAVPGITLHRTVLARQASRTAERTCRARTGQIEMREQSDAVSRLDSPGKRQLSQRLLSISQPHNKTARLIGTGRQGIVRDQNRLGCFQLLDIFYYHRLGLSDLQLAGGKINQESGHDNKHAEQEAIYAQNGFVVTFHHRQAKERQRENASQNCTGHAAWDAESALQLRLPDA